MPAPLESVPLQRHCAAPVSRNVRWTHGFIVGLVHMHINMTMSIVHRPRCCACKGRHRTLSAYGKHYTMIMRAVSVS